MNTSVKESYFWSQIKSGLEDPETHLSRVENSAGTGISDVSGCRAGVEVWLELKIFHGKRIHFRNSQKAWILKRSGVGGRVLVVARRDNELLIFEARVLMLVPAYRPESDGKSFSIHEDDLPSPLFSCVKPFKWEAVSRTIFGQT